MSSTPFRFVQRRTTISGRVPSVSSLLTGEILLQLADGTIYFRDAYQNKLHTVITDASGFGLNKIKFSGASSGQIPLWDGGKFIPYSTGDFGSNSNLDTSSFVLTGQTGQFVTTSQTGNFGSTINNYYGSAESILNTGFGSNSIQQTGSNNTSSGTYSVTIGSGNLAKEDFSFALGKEAKTSQFGEFAFSNGSFSEKGDSQYSLVMGRAITTSSTPQKILINGSDKIIELDLGSTVFFTANVVGNGGDKYISNEIRGIVKRSESEGSQIAFVNSPSKSIFALLPNGSNYSVNVSVSTLDNSLKIECVGDASEEMFWFAKIDLIILKKVSAFQDIYFKATNNGDWFNVDNWFSDSSFQNNTSFIPKSNSNVYMYGTYGDDDSYALIDNQLWVTPRIIHTTGLHNPEGLTLRSYTGSRFTGVIIGNSTFDGAIPDYAYNLNLLTANEISLLSPAVIASLTIGQISSLSAESINALTPAQLAALSPEQLAAISNLQLQSLFESNIDGYSTPINESIPNEFLSTLIVSSNQIPDLINTTLNIDSTNYLMMDSGSE